MLDQRPLDEVTPEQEQDALQQVIDQKLVEEQIRGRNLPPPREAMRSQNALAELRKQIPDGKFRRWLAGAARSLWPEREPGAGSGGRADPHGALCQRGNSSGRAGGESQRACLLPEQLCSQPAAKRTADSRPGRGFGGHPADSAPAKGRASCCRSGCNRCAARVMSACWSRRHRLRGDPGKAPARRRHNEAQAANCRRNHRHCAGGLLAVALIVLNGAPGQRWAERAGD